MDGWEDCDKFCPLTKKSLHVILKILISNVITCKKRSRFEKKKSWNMLRNILVSEYEEWPATTDNNASSELQAMKVPYKTDWWFQGC